MARLTSFSRLLITLAIVAGVYFAVKTFLPQFQNDNPDTTEVTTGGEDAPPADDAKTVSTWGKSVSDFNYTAPAPVNGVLKGVVELGATGFNSFIIKVDNQENWKLEKAEYGASLVYENLATDDDISKGLKNYIADMLAYGVGPKNIHFVISSGAKTVPVTTKISSILKGMGYYVNEVTPEQEAKLALKSCLPRSYYNKGFVVDIGSGNTKISWMAGSSPTGLELPGAKYYQRNQTAEEVYAEVSAKAKQVPSNLRSTCFIIGGVPFELAKQVRNGKERYTVLKAPGDYALEGDKQKAGGNIYKAIADATGCQQFVFDWDANFTIGFLLSL
ncbi:MAG: hypothetical protein EP344_18175 [Bacteroidetes bacterium]|nr:MAG: hypothetical protein EP344_18175 [Bacteroidota bacterium]